MATNLRVNSDS